MSYQLYRVASPCADVRSGVLLGTYRTFDEALCARDDDTARLFATTGTGQTLLACHQIVGPGSAGDNTAHPVTSHIPRGSGEDEADDMREWLRRIHTLS